MVFGAPAFSSLAREESTIGPSVAVYVCDLHPDLTEEELRDFFGTYGQVVHLQRPLTNEDGQVAVVEFKSCEAAFEAQRMTHHAVVRGRSCRCMLMSAYNRILETLATGNRLVVENLDLSLESHQLEDVCNIFGHVIDCKVETETPEGPPLGFGFVHFAEIGGAMKAMSILNGMQLGSCNVKLRRFEWADADRFAQRGASYTKEVPRWVDISFSCGIVDAKSFSAAPTAMMPSGMVSDAWMHHRMGTYCTQHRQGDMSAAHDFESAPHYSQAHGFLSSGTDGGQHHDFFVPSGRSLYGPCGKGNGCCTGMASSHGTAPMLATRGGVPMGQGTPSHTRVPSGPGVSGYDSESSIHYTVTSSKGKGKPPFKEQLHNEALTSRGLHSENWT